MPMRKIRRLFNNNEVKVISELYSDNHGTLKSLSDKFGVSKSTIYRCITIYIENVDLDLYNKCKIVRERNCKSSNKYVNSLGVQN